MSVIITDMHMPYSCYECRFRNRCEYALANGWLSNKRDDKCPLKPYEERKAKWIPSYGNVKCSVCGTVYDCREVGKATHYCSFCGAKMEGAEE